MEMGSTWIQETNTKLIIKPTILKKLCACWVDFFGGKGGGQERVGDKSYTLSLISSVLYIIRS